MNVWSFFDVATGALSGRTFAGSPHDLPSNTSEGFEALEGTFDSLCQRVDLVTGEVVDWQPPAPPDDEFAAHRWCADIKRWVPEPTRAAAERDRQARVKAEMAAVEALQARPTRELILDPSNRQALARLHALDRQLAGLRAEIVRPPPA